MATINTAPVIPLRQPRKAPKTGAERTKAWRERRKAKENGGACIPAVPSTQSHPEAAFGPAPDSGAPRSITRDVTFRDAVTSRGSFANRGVHLTNHTLTLAACALAAVGITMNGWFAQSLGSTDIAGWLFLAVGVASDCVALVVPSCATRHWDAHRRGAALVAWGVWAATFAFALSASIGFASVNIADVAASRASRVTPAVTTAQAALADATVARDRECKTGVGKVCREREEIVNERRRVLDAAMLEVKGQADPQAEAAIRLVTWVSLGVLKPSSGDFAMLRLALLSLLPQLGGLLLMIGRR